MKALLLLFAFSLAGYQSFSQPDLFKRRLNKVSIYPPQLNIAPNAKAPLRLNNKTYPALPGVVQFSIEKQKIGAINSTTDLYIIQDYGMPCIMPSANIKNNMPIAALRKQEQVLNDEQNLQANPK